LFGIAYCIYVGADAFAQIEFNRHFQFPWKLVACGAGGFLVLLFLGCVRSEPQYLRSFRAPKTYPAWSFLLELPEALASVFSEPFTGMKIFGDLLYCGPRCFLFAISMFIKSIRMFVFDVETCSRVLAVLLERGKRVSFEELEASVAKAFSRDILVQLHDITGVVFFTTPPLGLSLTEDLRAELRRAFVFVRFRSAPQFNPPPPPPDPEPVEEEILDELAPCYLLLGLPRDASLREVKMAYRKCLKNCHPDHFQDFGEDWQQMAQEKTRRLIDAYERIMAQNGG
jgi:hypothetical protein